MPSKKSPNACPKCGSCAVTRDSTTKTWTCSRCDHKATYFPKLVNLKFTSGEVTLPEGSPRGMASGGFMVRPTGNKYS